MIHEFITIHASFLAVITVPIDLPQTTYTLLQPSFRLQQIEATTLRATILASLIINLQSECILKSTLL